MLNKVIHGNPSPQAPLLIAHGLFGSARNWGVVAKRLSATRQVTVVDMRNHGESARFPTNSYPDMASDLASIVTDGWDVLGHSMGGKTVMTLALLHPKRIRRLIVADIAPVSYDHTQQPMIDAMRKVDLAQITSRRNADDQLSRDVAEPGVRAFLLQSLDVKNRAWKLNLKVLEAEMEKIIGFPNVKGQFDGPALFLSGAESTYVMPEHRAHIKQLFPKARFAKIPDAGHWLHADRPRAFEAAVDTFLSA